MPALRPKATIALRPSQQDWLAEVTRPPSAAAMDTRFSFDRTASVVAPWRSRAGDRDLFGGQPALGRFSASLAPRARQAGPLAFERLRNARLVAFDGPSQDLGLVASQRIKKPVPPPKGRRVAHTASFRRLGGAGAVDHRRGLGRPFVPHAQMRQGRFRQGVERALTAFAAVAGHGARLAPTHDGAAVALGAIGAVDAALPKAQPPQPLQPGSMVAPPAMAVRPALCLAWPPCQRLRCSGSTGCAFRCHRRAKPRTRRAPAMPVAAAAQSGPQSRPARTQTPPRPWWLSLVTDTYERPQQLTL